MVEQGKKSAVCATLVESSKNEQHTCQKDRFPLVAEAETHKHCLCDCYFHVALHTHGEILTHSRCNIISEKGIFTHLVYIYLLIVVSYEKNARDIHTLCIFTC